MRKIPSKPKKSNTKGVIPPRVKNAKESAAVFALREKIRLEKLQLEKKIDPLP